ncbi:MAG: zf-HC2 domain-containing protein [Rhodothermales bacterium]|nr:zf-HC2 domain-containing protein [Rhodothermales bacterium]
MTNPKDLSPQQPATCPTRQMSFADVARYLQEGFDDPVQSALSAHIQYCNACQDELDRVQAMMGTGRHLMGSAIVGAERENTDALLSEALVAAYLDGGLSENEQNLVTQHLADNYSSFAMFSAIEKELSEPVATVTPDRAVRRVQVAEPVPVPSYTEELRAQFTSWIASVHQVFELKWPAPALAFAAGVIAMLIIVPASRTIIPLPGAAVPSGDGVGILSGNMGSSAAPTGTVVTLPANIKGDVTFTWAEVEDAEYRAELFHPETGDVLKALNTDDAEWDLDVKIFEHGSTYTLFVTASTQESGIQPVATITIVRP